MKLWVQTRITRHKPKWNKMNLSTTAYLNQLRVLWPTLTCTTPKVWLRTKSTYSFIKPSKQKPPYKLLFPNHKKSTVCFPFSSKDQPWRLNSSKKSTHFPLSTSSNLFFIGSCLNTTWTTHRALLSVGWKKVALKTC